MRFARWSFGIAAAYGLIATLSLYFRAPLSAVTLWLFVFAGAAAATQLLYVLIATDPARFRPAIPVGIASKLSFAIPALLLWTRGAAPDGILAAGLVDLALAALFAVNYLRIGASANLR